MNRPPSAQMSKSRRLFWGMILGVVLVGGILSIGIFLFSPDIAIAEQILPVSIQSGLSADYSQDNLALVLQPVSMEVVAEAARDRQPTPEPGAAVQTPFAPYPTLVEILKTPVRTIAPVGAPPKVGTTPQPSPTAGIQPTDGPAATATPWGSKTPTATQMPTLRPTNTLGPRPTDPPPTSEPPTAEPPTPVPPTPVPPTPYPQPPPENTPTAYP